MISRYKRTTGKNNSDYSLKDLYKEYKSKSKNPVNYTTYAAVIKEYNDNIMKHIIYKNMSFKMPYKLGEIRGQRTKTKKVAIRTDGIVDKRKLPVDWNATINYYNKIYPDLTPEEVKAIKGKKRLYHLNLHTDGFRCRFFWDKFISDAKNQYYYKFVASRTNKNRMSSFINETERIPYYD